MYRISEIKLNIGEDKNNIPHRIKKKLGKSLGNGEITNWKVVKESIDARDKGDIKLVYTVDFEVSPEISLQLPKSEREIYLPPPYGSEKMTGRPVVCGFGPAGIFCALILAREGYRPLVIERGKAAAQRKEDVEKFWREGSLNPESNVQFGEGGAGTFSDGKLTTGIKDKRIMKVLSELADAGGGEEILYKQKPHIGTDVLRSVVVNIRNEIIKWGGEILFSARLERIYEEKGRLTGIEILREGEIKEKIETGNLVLAIGHSARDTFRTLEKQGLSMEQKPFSIGVRIEHPQELINRAQYGSSKEAALLPPAEYKLSYRCQNGRGVYTFCMCPGGEVIIASSQKSMVVTNGMSYNARDGKFANSALLVDVGTEDFAGDSPLSGIDFQEKYERAAFVNGGGSYRPPKALWKDFRDKTESGQAVRNSLPEFAVTAIEEAMPNLGRKLRGFDCEDAVLTGVETRSSSPVRIIRDENFESSIKGIYPAGEGAGYAGGIMSAAVDGIKIAEAIIKKYSPKEEEAQS